METNIKSYISYAVLLLFPLLAGQGSLFSRNTDEQFYAMSAKIEDICYSKGKEARSMLDELYRIAYQNREESELFSRCLYLETIVNNAQGRIDSTLAERLVRQLDYVSSKDNIYEKALLNYSLALCHTIKNDYAESFPVALQALEQFVSLNDSICKSQTLNLLGNICAYIRSYNMAEDYYREALRYITPSHIRHYLIRINLHMLSVVTGEAPKAVIDSIELLIEPIKNFHDTGTLVSLYVNIGGQYSALGDNERAFDNYDKCLNLIESLDNNRLMFALYQNLGYYYSAINNLDSAYKYYDISRNIALLEGESNIERLSHALSGIATVYGEKGNMDSAYHYLQQFNILNEKILNSSKTIETYQAYVSVLLDASRKELEFKEQELLLKNRGLIAALTAAIAAVLLIILLLIVIRQKKRQQALLNDNLASKVREITSYSLLLSNKNNTLQHVLSLTKQLPEKDKVNEINRVIKSNLNAQQDWETFMIHFEKVHPDFFRRLKARYGDLTKHNLRLCAYFRIGISNKEIAQILNVSPDAVKVSRRRLKKKLGLSEKDSLDDFIASI